jgi:hypothetical protein
MMIFLVLPYVAGMVFGIAAGGSYEASKRLSTRAV